MLQIAKIVKVSNPQFRNYYSPDYYQDVIGQLMSSCYSTTLRMNSILSHSICIDKNGKIMSVQIINGNRYLDYDIQNNKI